MPAAKRSSSSKKKPLNIKIKNPGALTNRAKRNKRTVNAQAQHDKVHGGAAQKTQANLYLNVFKPASKKRKKSSSIKSK
jgi:hypothetical protein